MPPAHRFSPWSVVCIPNCCIPTGKIAWSNRGVYDTLHGDTPCLCRICTTRTSQFLVSWACSARWTLSPIYPVPRAVTTCSQYTAQALGHMPCSGWCGVFSASSPLFHTPPVAWPSWSLDWVWPGPDTPARRLSHFELTFWRHHRPLVSYLATRSLLVNIPKIIPPGSLPRSQTWPWSRLVLSSSQQKLPSKGCSRYQIIFLFCLRLMAPSLRYLRWTSPFSRAFDS